MTSVTFGQFISRYPQIAYPRRATISGNRKYSKSIYYLESGLVKQFSVSASGNDFMTFLFRPGSVFPPQALNGEDPGLYYFEAFTPVTLRVVPVRDFIQQLHMDENTLLEFIGKLSGHFSVLSHRMNQLAGGTAYQRVVSALVYLGERIGYTNVGSNARLIKEVITHKELAAWSGTARETASIQIKKLQKRGIISYRSRQILIRSWDRLLRESGQ